MDLDDKPKEQAPSEETIEKARAASRAFKREWKRRRHEDIRRRAVEWSGGILAFFVINGSFFSLIQKLDLFNLLDKNWRLGSTFSFWIVSILWIGYAILFAQTFFWISDKCFKKNKKKKRKGGICP